jgi:1-acyl-sn-glycerol-3-phosphate acyltransferase
MMGRDPAIAATPWTAKVRLVILMTASGLLMCFVALALLPIAMLTLFLARRLYTAIAVQLTRAILRMWRIRLVVHHSQPLPAGQVVYISNHTSTLDMFMLVALGLPNTRFFLSGFLRKYVPLGVIAYLMGTFFTVPQSRPEERVRIFQRADRILRRTGESVYLSPEGERVVTGQIGHFNKGAFHLAGSLRAPIVPFYFQIPREMDPGRGFHAHPGTVHVYFMPAIDTRDWQLDDLERNKEQVREMFVRWHREIREVHEGELSHVSTPSPIAVAH